MTPDQLKALETLKILKASLICHTGRVKLTDSLVPSFQRRLGRHGIAFVRQSMMEAEEMIRLNLGDHLAKVAKDVMELAFARLKVADVLSPTDIFRLRSELPFSFSLFAWN